MKAAERRLEYLDSLRGLAILLVIATHVGSLIGVTGRLSNIVGILGFGVQLFFVISAFTISYTYQRSLEIGSRHPVLDFFIRRLLRIYPLYWVGIILYFAVYGLSSRGWLPGPEAWHFVLNGLLLNIWTPDSQSSVVPGGWSISVEVMFYCCFPVIARYVGTFKSSLFLLAITAVVLPGISHALKFFFYDSLSSGDGGLLDLWWGRTPLIQFGCFSFGFLFYYAVKENIFSFLKVWYWNLSGVVIGLTTLAFAVKFDILVVPKVQLYACGFSIVAVCLSYRNWSVIVNPIMAFVGRVSYSAYLLHFLVVFQLQNILKVGHDLGSFLLLYSFGTGVTLILSYISYRIIERPSMRLAKHLVGKVESKRSHPDSK